MRVVLLGPPGAGKGSLAALCQTRLQLQHLSTGALFRAEIAQGSALGRRVKRYVTGGLLVPDRLVVEVMAARLTTKVLTEGFVLDGFPRTQGQAVGLDRVLGLKRRPLDGAIYLKTPQTLLVDRLSGRRVCASCGANFHIRTMRPRRVGQCDHCQGTLIVRKDDQPATIRKRLAVDREASTPLLAYYERQGTLYPVTGAGRLHTVFERLRRLCQRQGWL